MHLKLTMHSRASRRVGRSERAFARRIWHRSRSRGAGAVVRDNGARASGDAGRLSRARGGATSKKISQSTTSTPTLPAPPRSMATIWGFGHALVLFTGAAFAASWSARRHGQTRRAVGRRATTPGREETTTTEEEEVEKVVSVSASVQVNEIQIERARDDDALYASWSSSSSATSSATVGRAHV